MNYYETPLVTKSEVVKIYRRVVKWKFLFLELTETILLVLLVSMCVHACVCECLDVCGRVCVSVCEHVSDRRYTVAVCL